MEYNVSDSLRQQLDPLVQDVCESCPVIEQFSKKYDFFNDQADISAIMEKAELERQRYIKEIGRPLDDEEERLVREKIDSQIESSLDAIDAEKKRSIYQSHALLSTCPGETHLHGKTPDDDFVDAIVCTALLKQYQQPDMTYPCSAVIKDDK